MVDTRSNNPSDVPEPQVPDRERYEILHRLEAWLETPMLVLGFIWLGLLILDLTRGLNPFLDATSTLIWIIFIIDFAIKFTLAPRKLLYLKTNWLTAIALIVPALRVFRIVRVVRLLRLARATRGLRLVRVVTSLNRGMKALGASMGRRGFGYVIALTAVVLFAGAAGMHAFERDLPGGLETYSEALWWTSMLLTSLGSEYWPQSAEGRMLCFLLGLYGFTVFGYVTASLATFFIGRDADSEASELAGAKSIDDLRNEIAALRGEIQALAEGRRE